MAEQIETLLKPSTVYHPTGKTLEQAYIKDYEAAYQESIADPEKFWEGMCQGTGMVCSMERGAGMELPVGKMVFGRALQYFV